MDFVVMEGMKVEQLVGKGSSALVEAMKSVEVEEGIVVTDDYFGEGEREGRRVRFVPLWCWLLRK